jgi:hypothetical protein
MVPLNGVPDSWSASMVTSVQMAPLDPLVQAVFAVPSVQPRNVNVVPGRTGGSYP